MCSEEHIRRVYNPSLMESFFPSKTFLLGEYLVLDQGPAIIATHAPHFLVQPKGSFPPLSPAARFLQNSAPALSIHDPHHGSGGFGASGAEFLAAFQSVFPHADSWQAWEAYRAIGTGSGSDILVQHYRRNQKEDALVFLDFQTKTLETLPYLGLHLRLFHTGKKLPTHEAPQSKLPFGVASSFVQQAKQACLQKNIPAFLSAIHAYSKLLQQTNLVTSHTQQALQALPPEVIAKGCGAMGADVILTTTLNLPHNWAKEHSLIEIHTLSV